MKHKTMFLLLVGLMVYSFLLGACAGTADPAPEEQSVPEEPQSVEVPLEDPPVPEPEEVEETDEFIVTEEVYEQTFEDVELFIDKLNTIIRNEDFDAWREHLTEEYIEYYSDPEVLREISEDLKKKYRYDLRIRSLRDYFIYIVVGSRQEATLDEIEFIDKTTILAYSVVNDTPVILYYLSYEDNGWKIARWQQ